MQAVVLVLFAIFAGTIFSMVGAAGGLISSFFLMNFSGLESVNDVKLMTQVLVLSSALVFIPSYFKSKRVVWPIGILLGTGGVFGSLLGSYVSSKYLNNPKSFLPIFATFTLFVAFYILWKTLKPKDNAQEKSQNDQQNDYSVKNVKFGLTRLNFKLANKEYNINLYLPILAGFLIAFVASMLGVGGGFMLVPFVTVLLDIPMYVAPATVAVAIVISLLVSISNYINLGATVDMRLLSILVPGVIVGALLGPILNKKLKIKYLNIILAIVLFVIALKYLF